MFLKRVQRLGNALLLLLDIAQLLLDFEDAQFVPRTFAGLLHLNKFYFVPFFGYHQLAQPVSFAKHLVLYVTLSRYLLL